MVTPMDMPENAHDELIAEQQAFYEADAEAFDAWLASLLDDTNVDDTARRYRAGRLTFLKLLDRLGPLGDVLEIAAGTGRLAPLYIPKAKTATLIDSSVTSLELATRNIRAAGHDQETRFAAGDVFDPPEHLDQFDTLVFSAWLHHVPQSRFESFWNVVDSHLTSGGDVIFDFPDARKPQAGADAVPPVPSEEYNIYRPVDGISYRDHHGKRWRVIHRAWDPEDLISELRFLGWRVRVEGPGMFNDILWATAKR